MSFTQDKGNNVLFCTGCAKNCHYSAFRDENGYYLPMIGTTVVREYVAAGGYGVTVGANFFADKALQQAYKISRLCDNYKVR